MVFGTFDGLHSGHLNFFKQAKKFGDYLVIVIARDKNVKKIKGCLPKFKEDKRLNKVRAIRVGEKVILGQLRDPYEVIRREKPAVICLGYDQNSFSADLAKKFPRIKIVRLRPYKPEVYKSSKINPTNYE